VDQAIILVKTGNDTLSSGGSLSKYPKKEKPPLSGGIRGNHADGLVG
jgi:hypothetical protein